MGTIFAELIATKDYITSTYRVKMVLYMFILHASSLYFFIMYGVRNLKPQTILYSTFMGYLAGLGITAGAHRLYCHRSYKAKWPVRLFFICCYSMACHLTLSTWVRIHRTHHRHTDTEGDPHNSKRGLVFSHMGWLMMKKSPECMKREQETDISDVEEDPMARVYDKYFTLISTVALLLPAIVPILCWGEEVIPSFLVLASVRTVIVFHFTNSINSIAHKYGTKPYDNRMVPTDGSVLSFFTLGEGWHNYHHCFPWDYRAGEFGPKLNFTTYLLDVFARCGWVYDLKTASPSMISAKKLKYGDGHHVH